MQPELRIIQEQIDVLRSTAKRRNDSGFTKTADQLLEYTPVVSLPYLKRWLATNNLVHPVQSAPLALLRNIEQLGVVPVLRDFVSYISKVTSLIEMPASFAKSQVWLQDKISLSNTLLMLSVEFTSCAQ